MKLRLPKRIFIILATCFVIFIIVFITLTKKPSTQPMSPSLYNAVFLTNGQVYFGHIKSLDNNTIILTDVFYLQANTSLTPQDNKTKQTNTNLQVALIKLGNEIHGPKDMMMINKTNVLFWEELRNDGKVVQAIKAYKP